MKGVESSADPTHRVTRSRRQTILRQIKHMLEAHQTNIIKKKEPFIKRRQGQPMT